jgi:Flp pilus assembly CpaF family ATPase
MTLYVYYYNKVLSTSRASRRVELVATDQDAAPALIGKSPEARVHLDSPYVPDVAAEIISRDGSWLLKPRGGGHACLLGSTRLTPGRAYRVENRQTFEVFPFLIEFRYEDTPTVGRDRDVAVLNDRVNDLIRDLHRELVPTITFELSDLKSPEDVAESLNELENNIERIAARQSNIDQALIDHLAALCVRCELLNELMTIGEPSQADGQDGDIWHGSVVWRQLASAIEQLERELRRFCERVGGELGIVYGGPRPDAEAFSEQVRHVEEDFWRVWAKYPKRLQDRFKQYLALRQLKRDIKDIVYGYGPIEDLILSPSISEIMVVSRDKLYIERHGVLENSGRRFVSDQVTESIIQRMVNNVGGRIDRAKPLADARLRDGSRINAVIAPLAVSGPCLTIRKFARRRLTVADLIEQGSLTRETAAFLSAAVAARRNIIVSGGTGTGKTTLLNVLSSFIPDRERIITVEDVAELTLDKLHVVRLETRAENIEGRGAVTIRDLVKNALRMRPDRILVGECRAGEALDMLQAMNTGHDGSMTSIHANSAEGVIARLEVLVQMASEVDLPVVSIHKQIASAIDLIVQVRREPDGARRVAQIAECVGLDPNTQRVRMRDLFLLDGEPASLRPTGRLPSFLGQLIDSGRIDIAIFFPGPLRRGVEGANHASV